MIREILWIGAGSAIGGISRYAIGKWMTNLFIPHFPFSTLAINILGSFLIGIFLGLQHKESLPTTTILFLTTGFCGGFTTFSTFSVENIELIKQGNIGLAIVYMFSSLVLGILAVYLGNKIIMGQ